MIALKYSIYRIIFFPGTTLANVNQTHFIEHIMVYWEKYESHKPSIQCFRCQAHGHSSTNCNKNAVCFKCAGAHNTSECTKLTCKLLRQPHSEFLPMFSPPKLLCQKEKLQSLTATRKPATTNQPYHFLPSIKQEKLPIRHIRTPHPLNPPDSPLYANAFSRPTTQQEPRTTHTNLGNPIDNAIN